MLHPLLCAFHGCIHVHSRVEFDVLALLQRTQVLQVCKGIVHPGVFICQFLNLLLPLAKNLYVHCDVSGMDLANTTQSVWLAFALQRWHGAKLTANLEIQVGWLQCSPQVIATHCPAA